MIDTNEYSGSFEKIQIRNPAEIARKIGALIVLFVLSSPLLVTPEQFLTPGQILALGEETVLDEGLIYSLIFSIISPLAALFIPIFIIKIYVLWGGFIIDPSGNSFSISSGMEANSFLTYLNPFWWFHRWGLLRRKIALNEITQISTDAKIKQRTFSRPVEYDLKVEGLFGAITCEFVSKGKRDQLYSMFQQILQMGVPITKV